MCRIQDKHYEEELSATSTPGAIWPSLYTHTFTQQSWKCIKLSSPYLSSLETICCVPVTIQMVQIVMGLAAFCLYWTCLYVFGHFPCLFCKILVAHYLWRFFKEVIFETWISVCIWVRSVCWCCVHCSVLVLWMKYRYPVFLFCFLPPLTCWHQIHTPVL